MHVSIWQGTPAPMVISERYRLENLYHQNLEVHSVAKEEEYQLLSEKINDIHIEPLTILFQFYFLRQYLQQEG